uniref:Uncharacterized protein n=1 Tax=Arundo donax TaxID=35708 RepID=A0A0A9BFD9_ARUDO
MFQIKLQKLAALAFLWWHGPVSLQFHNCLNNLTVKPDRSGL